MTIAPSIQVSAPYAWRWLSMGPPVWGTTAAVSGGTGAESSKAPASGSPCERRPPRPRGGTAAVSGVVGGERGCHGRDDREGGTFTVRAEGGWGGGVGGGGAGEMPELGSAALTAAAAPSKDADEAGRLCRGGASAGWEEARGIEVEVGLAYSRLAGTTAGGSRVRVRAPTGTSGASHDRAAPARRSADGLSLQGKCALAARRQHLSDGGTVVPQATSCAGH